MVVICQERRVARNHAYNLCRRFCLWWEMCRGGGICLSDEGGFGGIFLYENITDG